MNSIGKVNKLCRSVLTLTDEDLDAVDKMAKEQKNYIHPLKGARQEKFNKMGTYNQRVLSALKKLREVLLESRTEIIS